MGFVKPSRPEGSGQNSDLFIVNQHVGTLILFKVVGQKADYQTPRFGVKPTVWADVLLVDGPRAGTLFPRAEIFHTNLYTGLFDHVGETVLARLNKGTSAFLLNDATPEDEAYAEQFLARFRAGEVAPPAPVGDPWDPQASAPVRGGNPFAEQDEPPF